MTKEHYKQDISCQVNELDLHFLCKNKNKNICVKPLVDFNANQISQQCIDLCVNVGTWCVAYRASCITAHTVECAYHKDEETVNIWISCLKCVKYQDDWCGILCAWVTPDGHAHTVAVTQSLCGTNPNLTIVWPDHPASQQYLSNKAT